MCCILGLLLPFDLVVWDLVVFVDADLLFVGFVSLCEFCCLVFSSYDASVKEGTFLLCQEPKGVADVFWGWLFFHSFSCCLRFIVVVKSFRWARCNFDVGGESCIFVGGTMFKAVQCRLNSVNLSVFFPRTSIHFSSSEPSHRHSLLVVPLSLLLSLLLFPDTLLANPPMAEE